MIADTPPLLALLLLSGTGATENSAPDFEYVSPRPGAELVAPGSTIILRPRIRPDRGVAAIASIDLDGSVSGSHGGEWITAGGGETCIFRPREPFAPGEVVSATVRVDAWEDDFSFHFTISPKTRSLESRPIHPCEAAFGAGRSPTVPGTRGGVVLPESFPAITVTINDGPAPGYIFAAPAIWSDPQTRPHYAVMLESTGSPVFFRETFGIPTDFKKQSHAHLYSFLQNEASRFRVLDDSFALMDRFGPENGYTVIDGHDFQIAPNGNALVGIKDYQTIDMSQIVPGGNPAAIVQGFVMQEQDAAHNVVFQWRSWDHFEITDATTIDLTAPIIDYVHWNAAEYDTDGNIMISSRHLDETTKIDRQTGDIIWRMGGSQNEFTLVGDAQWYTRQHAVRRTASGTVTMFDNGNLSAPQESRAVEYDLDEVNKVATMVWEYRNSPPIYSGFMGNAQRLANGNTLISWGVLGIITEVRPDGTKAFEMVFDDMFTYRAAKYEWAGSAARPELWYMATPTEVTLHFEKFGDSGVALFHVYSGSSPNPTTRVGSTPDNSFVIDVSWPETLYVRVTAEHFLGIESPFSNEVEIVVPIPVDAPIARESKVRVTLHQNHPNPFAPATAISFALPERGLVDLSVYDVRGRLVRTLAHRVMVRGHSEIIWDGTDSRGRRASAGVYYYRLRSHDQEMTKRMTLLR